VTAPKGAPVCRHCGGSLIYEDGERKCLSCGRTWKTLSELHRFYEEHKVEILQDIAELGRPAATKKWMIPASTLSLLLKCWFNLHDYPPSQIAAPGHNGKMPRLPAFSNDWPPEVQLAWLETYRDLAKKKGEQQS